MQTRVSRKALLAYGILASLTYFASDILASLRYPTYNFSDQAVSELIAIGAPAGVQASTPDLARRQFEESMRLSVALRRTKLEVDVIKNAERRTSLTEQWADAGRSLRDVVAGIHTFDQQRVEERLIGARAQVNQLRAELARR